MTIQTRRNRRAGRTGPRTPVAEPAVPGPAVAAARPTSADVAAVVETHASVVVLLGDRAYKTKKPVDLGFLDFTTRAARREACEREVALNTRLAPDVYLGLGWLQDPVRGPEPVVAMRRMPADRRLSHLVEVGVITDDQVRAVARTLSVFHAAARHGPSISAEAGPPALQRRWESGVRELRTVFGLALDGRVLDEIEHLAGRFLAGRADLLAWRADDGRVVDGHGDLHADDVYCLPDGPRVLDCVEYDDRARCVDQLDDVAGLAMDLEHRGAPAAARTLLDSYVEFTDDPAPAALLHHFIAGRALARARVRALDGAHARPTAEVASYAQLCVEHLRTASVRLVLVGGRPGSGRSTLAGDLADHLGAVLLDGDRVRSETPGGEAADVELLARTRRLLAMGESVVLDAGWSRAADRAAAADLARSAAAELTVLACTDGDTAGRQAWPGSWSVDTRRAREQCVAVAAARVRARR